MRCSHRSLYTCLLALATVAPVGASAGPAAKLPSCSVTAKGWKGHVTGTKLKPTHPAVELRVVMLVNRFRRQHGLRPLTLDPGLGYAARERGITRATPTLALYSPSTCTAEKIVRLHGPARAAGIVRHLRSERSSRHVLLLPWARRIGVGIRVGIVNGGRVTTAAVALSAARPRPRRAPVKPRTTAPAVSVPAAPPTPSGSLVGVPYTCNGPVNGLRVVGTGSDSRALVNLAAGCTGTLSLDIHITSGGGDGVKVQSGAHDLTIGPSRIVCDRLDSGSFHQDGVQVQGGTNVTFSGLHVVCPYVSGAGAAAFYIDGKDFSGIRNVICDGCNLEHTHDGALFTGPAPGSGVSNSIIHEGALTHSYFQKTGDLSGLLDFNNTLAPPCDDVTVTC